jgi:hypothetical protein
MVLGYGCQANINWETSVVILKKKNRFTKYIKLYGSRPEKQENYSFERALI